MEHNKAFVEAIINRMKTVLGVDSDTEAAKLLGGTRSMLSLWKNRGSIPFQQCIDLARERNISLDWLMLGRGRMEVVVNGAELDTENALYVEVPQTDATTMFAEDRQIRPWALSRAWVEEEGLDVAELIVVRAAGDAMGATIGDGQLVIVDCRLRDIDGIYLVRWGDSVRFRRLQRMVDGSIHLLCDNPAYKADIVPAADADKLLVIGYCHAAITLLR